MHQGCWHHRSCLCCSGHQQICGVFMRRWSIRFGAIWRQCCHQIPPEESILRIVAVRGKPLSTRQQYKCLLGLSLYVPLWMLTDQRLSIAISSGPRRGKSRSFCLLSIATIIRLMKVVAYRPQQQTTGEREATINQLFHLQ